MEGCIGMEGARGQAVGRFRQAEDEEEIYVPPFLEVPVPGLPDHDVIDYGRGSP